LHAASQLSSNIYLESLQHVAAVADGGDDFLIA